MTRKLQTLWEVYHSETVKKTSPDISDSHDLFLSHASWWGVEEFGG